MTDNIQLEAEAQEFADLTAKPPFIFEMAPDKVAEDVRRSAVEPAREACSPDRRPYHARRAGGEVSVRIVRPQGPSAGLPVIVYLHGGGWVVGNSHTHDRLIRELAVACRRRRRVRQLQSVAGGQVSNGTGGVLRRREMGGRAWERNWPRRRSPRCRWRQRGRQPDGGRHAAGQGRGGPPIRQQLLFYPVTDASFDTESYHQFATDYFLRRDAMMWFWDQYANGAVASRSNHRLAAPGDYGPIARPAAGAGDHGRGRRAPRRRRGLCQ